MQYQNPKIPENINTSKTHPLRELVLLLSGVGLVVAALAFILIFFSEYFSAYIPFSAEKKLAAYYESSPVLENEKETVRYLNQLGQRIAQVSQLAEGMTITIHYVDDDTVNAFATLGGNIVVFRGLLEKMPNQNALAMVIAHEIAHIKLRHPIKAAGRSVAFAAAMTLFGQVSGSQMAGQMLNQAGTLTVLNFTRKQEDAADRAALAAIYQLYGHTNGANAIFDLFQTLEKNDLSPELFRSHPYSKNRNQAMMQQAKDNHWPLTGKLVELPPAWLPEKH